MVPASLRMFHGKRFCLGWPICFDLGCGQSSLSTEKNCGRTTMRLWTTHPGGLDVKWLPQPSVLVVLFWKAVGALGDGDEKYVSGDGFGASISVPTSCLVSAFRKHKQCGRQLWLLPPCLPCHHRLYPFKLRDGVAVSSLKLLLFGCLVTPRRMYPLISGMEANSLEGRCGKPQTTRLPEG